MIRVALETGNNELVTHGRIPPFLTLPEVIHWGVRTFRLTAPNTSPETAAIYTEVFAVALVDPMAPPKEWLDGDERRNGVKAPA